MEHAMWALAGVAIVSLAGQGAAYSLVSLRRASPTLLLTLIALAAGAMAGEALLHAIPEAVEAWQGHDLRGMGILLVVGFGLAMSASWFARHRSCCSTPTHSTIAFSGAPPASAAAGPDARASVWTTLSGDAACNFADGVAIAASFLVSVPLGIAATIAILIHEVPQELGQCAVFLRGGLSPRRVLAWNAASAVPAFAGAALVLALPFAGSTVERYALPAVAGAFLHIAAADLLPEVRRALTARNTLPIGGGFAAGIAVMVLLLGLEG